MNYLFKACLFFIFLVTLNPCAKGQKLLKAHAVTAFVNINVITMHDSIPLMDQTVIIRDDVITAIGPSSTIQIPENALTIDGEHQKYMTPGLVDTHVHLHKPKAKEWMAYFIRYGVTTVFNLKGNKKILSMQDEVKTQHLLGPDIYTSGPFIGVNNKRLDKITKKGVEKAVLKQKKAGYDMIKIHGDMTLEVYQHLMNFSRLEGMHVMGHIPRNLTFQDAIDVKQLSLAHAEEMIYTQFTALDVVEIPPFAKQAGEMGMWLMPGMMTFDRLSKSWANPSVIDSVMPLPQTQELHPEIQKIYKQDWYGDRDADSRDYFQRANAFHTPLVKSMYASGVHLLLGTDAPMPNVTPGLSVHEEIDQLLAIGITPLEVLKIGTCNAGEYVATHLQKEDRFGQIAVGYRANLLLLSSNPLEDMSILRTPEGVMLGGSWYDDKALKSMITW